MNLRISVNYCEFWVFKKGRGHAAFSPLFSNRFIWEGCLSWGISFRGVLWIPWANWEFPICHLESTARFGHSSLSLQTFFLGMPPIPPAQVLNWLFDSLLSTPTGHFGHSLPAIRAWSAESSAPRSEAVLQGQRFGVRGPVFNLQHRFNLGNLWQAT